MLQAFLSPYSCSWKQFSGVKNVQNRCEDRDPKCGDHDDYCSIVFNNLQSGRRYSSQYGMSFFILTALDIIFLMCPTT
jgi:hypothetical protein